MEKNNYIIDRLRFFECEKCKGLGVFENKTCDICKGAGIAVLFRNKVFYFGKNINAKTILDDKIKNYSMAVLRIIFGFIAVLGIVSFGYRLFTADVLYWTKLFVIPDTLMLFFWISMIFVLFLYYSFVSKEIAKENVITKTYIEEDWRTESEGFAWQNLDKYKKTDISKSFTNQAVLALQNAYQNAFNYNHESAEEIHVLDSLLEYSKVLVVFGRLEINLNTIKEKIKKILETKIKVTPLNPVFSIEAKKKIIAAYFEAFDSKQKKVDVLELLVIFAEDSKDYIKDLLFDLQIDYTKIKNAVEWVRITDVLRSQSKKTTVLANARPKGGLDKAMTAVSTPVLDSYSEDITKEASYGNLFPILDRFLELEDINRMIESGMESIIIIGNDGVGKTAMIEGLCQKIINGEVPQILQEKRVVRLSIPKLLAGINISEAQERLMNIFYEISRAKNVILVIENVQNLLGIRDGGAESMDLGAILAQNIEKKYFIAICTSNTSDYSKYIEKSVLANALKKVEIKEPDLNTAIQILEEHSALTEAKHKVFFSYAAIENIVHLSQKYFHEGFLPKKALDLMNEAAIYVKSKKGQNSIVTGEDAAEFLSKKINMPLTKVTTSESEKLLSLEQKIHERVIDQDEAVKMVAESIKRARMELRSEKRPISNLLFLGPTGVGKTELAKTVAEVYFGSEKNMIRLDMSEYQEAASVNTLIGAPSGYVGSEKSGVLTEAVRKNPYTLLLLDELEKANQDVLNMFLQVMDEGRLTDNFGNTVDFTNVILIATSNAATAFIQEQLNLGKEIEQIKNDLLDFELKKYFKPEFINRFDGIIVFKPLGIEQVKQIAQLMLKDVIKKLDEKEIVLAVSEEALEEIAKQGYDPQYGARPLRRVISDKVENLLANAMLKNELLRGDTVELKINGELDIKHRK